jgi:hypothetical protein
VWRSAYHRVSDDSVSSYGGHATRELAEFEALRNFRSDDIDVVWVRDPDGVVVFRRAAMPVRV